MTGQLKPLCQIVLWSYSLSLGWKTRHSVVCKKTILINLHLITAASFPKSVLLNNKMKSHLGILPTKGKQTWFLLSSDVFDNCSHRRQGGHHVYIWDDRKWSVFYQTVVWGGFYWRGALNTFLLTLIWKGITWSPLMWIYLVITEIRFSLFFPSFFFFLESFLHFQTSARLVRGWKIVWCSHCLVISAFTKQVQL